MIQSLSVCSPIQILYCLLIYTTILKLIYHISHSFSSPNKMSVICDRCKNTYSHVVECCYGHKFCWTCLVSDGHNGKFICRICEEEICNSYHFRNKQCQHCFAQSMIRGLTICITCNENIVDKHGKGGECIVCIFKKFEIRLFNEGKIGLLLESIRDVPAFSSIFENPRYKEFIDRMCKTLIKRQNND